MASTIKDVAAAAGVSVATASRALNDVGNVTPATQRKVVAAAQKLSYIPHSGARSLSTRHTQTIGAVLPDLHGDFFSELIRGIDRVARMQGLHLLLSSSHGDARELASALDPQDFVQVHRSTIVNLAHLAGMRRDEASRLFLRMKGHAQELPVSRAYVHLFKAM